MTGWRLGIIGSSGVVAATWSCVAFMDLGVDQYKLADDGAAPVSDAGLCEGACPTLLLSCRSASDCDAGAVCCLVPTSLTSVEFSCQPGTCSGTLSFQLCATNAECRSASCVRQQCRLDGVVVKDVGACGALPGCAPF